MYIKRTEDLFQITSKRTSPLRGFLERSSHFRLFKLWEKRSTDDDTIHYISDHRIDLFINMIITAVGLVMLITPLWILAFVKPMTSRLSIITAFICVFLLLVTSLSVARPSELLAATAAYVFAIGFASVWIDC